MKKIISLILVLTMALAVAVPVFADGDGLDGEFGTYTKPAGQNNDASKDDRVAAWSDVIAVKIADATGEPYRDVLEITQEYVEASYELIMGNVSDATKFKNSVIATIGFIIGNMTDNTETYQTWLAATDSISAASTIYFLYITEDPEALNSGIMKGVDKYMDQILDSIAKFVPENYLIFVNANVIKSLVSGYLQSNKDDIMKLYDALLNTPSKAEVKIEQLKAAIVDFFTKSLTLLLGEIDDDTMAVINDFADEYAKKTVDEYGSDMYIATAVSTGERIFMVAAIAELAVIIILIVMLAKKKNGKEA